MIEKDDYLIELSRYIHLNPVRANIVKRPEDYRWSSLRYYVNGQSNNFLFLKDILNPFGEDGRAYLKFVYDGIGKEFSLYITQGLYLGSKEFIDKIRDRIAKKDVERKQNSDTSFYGIKEGVCM